VTARSGIRHHLATMADQKSDLVHSIKDATHQAGGGVSAEPQRVKTVNATLIKHLQSIYNQQAAKGDHCWHKEQLIAFVKSVQGDNEVYIPADLLAKPDVDFNGFLHYVTSSASSIVAPDKGQDLSWPLSSYFISSSHNTYLTGNQLYSDSSTDAYKNVLLRGCRCIEIDVWDGDDSDSESSESSESDEDGSKKAAKRKDTVKKAKDKLPPSLTSRLENTSLGKRLGAYVDKKTEPKAAPPAAVKPAAATPPEEKKAPAQSAPVSKAPATRPTIVEPRVLHGFTLTKEVSFRDVCYAIRDNAFEVTDLPLIVSLEVHCGAAQQEVMVKIMESAWKDFLVPHPGRDAEGLPTPGDLKKKILVKVKYAPPESDRLKPGVEADAGVSEDETAPAAGGAKKPKKPSKIIQALSQLGIYTRGVSFKSLLQPEAEMPTHVFSLSEKGVMDVHDKDSSALFNHNKFFMMRTYPSGLRIGSSNLDPAAFWRKGIQIVALNWQNWDEGMMLNEAMFAGTGGMVLKPEGELSKGKRKPRNRVSLTGTPQGTEAQSQEGSLPATREPTLPPLPSHTRPST
jgi:phosphatidylinositol phospholipase C, delta